MFYTKTLKKSHLGSNISSLHVGGQTLALNFITKSDFILQNLYRFNIFSLLVKNKILSIFQKKWDIHNYSLKVNNSIWYIEGMQYFGESKSSS